MTVKVLNHTEFRQRKRSSSCHPPADRSIHCKRSSRTFGPHEGLSHADPDDTMGHDEARPTTGPLTPSQGGLNYLTHTPVPFLPTTALLYSPAAIKVSTAAEAKATLKSATWHCPSPKQRSSRSPPTASGESFVRSWSGRLWLISQALRKTHGGKVRFGTLLACHRGAHSILVRQLP